MRGAIAVSVATASLAATAQQAPVIAGGVYEDRTALAVRSSFVPVAGARVKLYRDGGDSLPSADDVPVAATKTDAAGEYAFRTSGNASYWVVVDSRTIGSRNAWPEQTFGPAGSLCARPDGTPRTTYFEGACFGGRTATVSDDASSLMTSEHLALVSLSGSPTSVDFAFSFNAVTSTADGEGIQGSLRQFVVNANAMSGPNQMRFVPLERPREQREPSLGLPLRWWTIVLATPLPELTDADTTLDGTAYNYLSPDSVSNVNVGRIGEALTVKPEERAIPRLEKPELELTLNGAEGIVCAARCGVRAMAVHGAPTAIVTRADARIEHVLIGAAPDAVASVDRGTTGLQIERGTAAVRHLLVTNQSSSGIIVGREGRIEGERLDVSRCGDPQTGGGIVLLSDGSFIRSSTITINPGAGVLIGAPDGSAPASANTIDGCTISGNQAGVVLGPGSSRNVVTRNDIMWNRLGGVTSAPYEKVAPRENRISANRFDENGFRPIVLDLGAANPNELSRGGGPCESNATAPNAGISAPHLTEVKVVEEEKTARVVMKGKACPGQIVELYQSYVTSGVREEKQSELPRIRNEKVDTRETMTNQEREMALPSIGEFNYLGATNTSPDGSFEAAFPLPVVLAMKEESKNDENRESNIWAHQVLPGSDPSDRAFSAIAIDAAGNTSEMSVRRQVD